MPARYDQHFLVDGEAADAIVDAADLRPGDPVVEIGPGKGVLTERLVARGIRPAVVEVDPRLIPKLRERFGEHIDLIHSDFLKLELSRLPESATVVSNLPYSVATPILQRILDWTAWDLAVLMFQREVAERLFAAPGTKAYSLLTLSVSLKAEATSLLTVGPASFDPPPKVDSGVVRLDRLAKPRLPEGLSEKAFFRVAKAAFSQRRKRAVKAVAHTLGMDRERVEEAFAKIGIDPDARAEAIGLDEFLDLAESLSG